MLGGTACNGDHVAGKGGVVDGVHAHADAHAGFRGQRQFGNERGMLGFATHGGAVFAIEGDVEYAGAESSAISAWSARLFFMRASTPL